MHWMHHMWGPIPSELKISVIVPSCNWEAVIGWVTRGHVTKIKIRKLSACLQPLFVFILYCTGWILVAMVELFACRCSTLPRTMTPHWMKLWQDSVPHSVHQVWHLIGEQTVCVYVSLTFALLFFFFLQQLLREMQQMASRPFATINVALETDEEPPDLIGGNVKVSATFSSSTSAFQCVCVCGCARWPRATELRPSLPVSLIFTFKSPNC